MKSAMFPEGRPETGVFDLLQRSVIDHPKNLAVIHGDRKLDFRALFVSSVRIADYLSSLPLEKGDRAAILFENSIEYTLSFFAASRAGLVIVPIDTSLRPDKISYILNHCGASVLFAQAKFERHLGRMLERSSSVRFVLSESPLKTAPSGVSGASLNRILDEKGGDAWREAGPETVDPETLSSRSSPGLAAIFYTSGSTGTPKGVMLSHRNLVSNTFATVRYLKLSPGDRVIVILPFYYIYGNSLLLTHVAAGGTLVIDNRFLYPEVVLDTMEREEVTGLSGVPSTFAILLGNSSFASRPLRHLRYVTQAGGAMAPELQRKLIKSLPGKEIYIMYGLTEASPRVSYVPPERLRDKVGSIGIPVPGVRMKIVSEEGTEALPGEEGEIAVSGENVMLGYWRDPEESDRVLAEGWLRTGDLGKKDEEGFFYVAGRKADILKVRGRRVSAKEIEECIMEMDSVAEVAVVGVHDEILGEAIKAFVGLRAGGRATEREVQNHCRIRLGDQTSPKFVEFMPALPKYKSGKVNKEMLRSRA